MSTTRDDLISREGFSYQWVLAIEGYEYLITDGPAAAAATAWAATPWTQALSGLAVMGDFDQSLDAFEAFATARSLSFSVMDCDDTDRFGIDVARPSFGAKTWLGADIDVNDTTITVKDTANFTSSGTIYIGTERIAYTGKTATTFTGCTRGMYAPFNRDGSTSHQYGKTHNLPEYDFNVQILPLVTQNPQAFIGRWVGLWMHRKRGGVMDAKAEALLVYAGKISDVRDSALGITSVSCTDIIDIVKNATVFNDPLECRVREGMEISIFDRLNVQISVDGTATVFYDNNLTPGYWTLEQIISDINTIWGGVSAASPNTTMGMALINTDAGWRVEISAKNTTAGNKQCFIVVSGAKRILQFLGLHNFDNSTGSTAEAQHGYYGIGPFSSSATVAAYQQGGYEPLRVADAGSGSKYNTALATTLTSIYIDSAKGTFIDQSAFLPQSVDTGFTYGTGWCLWMMAKRLYVGRYDEANSKIEKLEPVDGFMETEDSKKGNSTLAFGRLPYSAKAEDFVIKQVVVIEESTRNLIVKALCSTSVPGYAHATYDAYGGKLGAAIPYEPIASLVESLARIDGTNAANSSMVLLDKPTTIKELFNADLILRQAFLHWHNGSIRAAKWSVPRAAKAIASLTESNKAGSAGDPQRVTSERTDRFLRNAIKIEYNKVPGKNEYESSFNFVDVASQQSYGVERAVTIQARNSYGDYATTGDSVKALAPGLLGILPLFSRPRFECRRTIDHTLYEKLYVGAPVTITDLFLRDPSTGLRGVINRPAICTRLRYDFGGWEFEGGEPRQNVGEADFLMLDSDDGKPLCPAAVVDHAFGSFGYTGGFDGVQSLRTVAKEFAATSESEDLAAFAVGDAISIIEINPDDPAAPIHIDCNITAIASLYYLAVDVLLTPAGFVAGREYKIIPREYAAAITAQKAAYSYLADASYTVDAARDAYTFGEDDDQSHPLALAASVAYMSGGKIAEHQAAEADGQPFDVCSQVEMLRALEHLCDGRLATISSFMRPSSTMGGIFVVPTYISGGTATGSMRRNLAITAECNAPVTVGYVSITVSEKPPRMSTRATAFLPSKISFDGKFDTTNFIPFAPGALGLSLDYETARGKGDGLLWVTIMPRGDTDVTKVKFYGLKRFQLEERTGI